MTDVAGPVRRVDVVRSQLRACAAAFTFLTRLPLRRVMHGPEDLPRAATYFPVVGLVVGLAGGAVYAGAVTLWPTTIALLLSLATTVFITGAFHEDALADAFDGFGGGWDRGQILAIMKDSRVGSYALVGMFVVLAIKLAALATLAGSPDATLIEKRASVIRVLRALVAGHVLGRWSSVFLMRTHPYVRPAAETERASAGRPFARGASTSQLVVASVISLLIVVSATGSQAVIATPVALVITWIAGRYFDNRIGGITGDALGAASQIVELSVYLTLVGF